MQARKRLQTFVPFRSAIKVADGVLPEPCCHLVSSLYNADTSLALALVSFLPCKGTLAVAVHFARQLHDNAWYIHSEILHMGR